MTLPKLSFTRDSALWLVMFISGVSGFLLMQFDQVVEAFPAVTPIWRARLSLVSALSGFVGGYLRMSPRPLNPQSSVRVTDGNPTTTLNMLGQPKA